MQARGETAIKFRHVLCWNHNKITHPFLGKKQTSECNNQSIHEDQNRFKIRKHQSALSCKRFLLREDKHPLKRQINATSPQQREQDDNEWVAVIAFLQMESCEGKIIASERFVLLMQHVVLQRTPTMVSINNRGLTKMIKHNNYNLTNRERSRCEQRWKLELVAVT